MAGTMKVYHRSSTASHRGDVQLQAHEGSRLLLVTHHIAYTPRGKKKWHVKYRIAPGLPLSHDVDTSTLPPNRGHIHVAIHLASSPDFHLFVSPLFKEHVVHSAPRRSMRRRDRQCNTCAAQKKTPPFAKRDKTRPPSGDIHSIITSSHRLHYCPIVLGGIHTTGLNFHVHLRPDSTIPFSHLASVTRLASKGLGVVFFFSLHFARSSVCVFSCLGYSYYRR